MLPATNVPAGQVAAEVRQPEIGGVEVGTALRQRDDVIKRSEPRIRMLQRHVNPVATDAAPVSVALRYGRKIDKGLLPWTQRGFLPGTPTEVARLPVCPFVALGRAELGIRSFGAGKG